MERSTNIIALSNLRSPETHSRVTRRERLLQGFEQRGGMRELPITPSFDLLSLRSPDFSAFERPADCASFPFFGARSKILIEVAMASVVARLSLSQPFH